jgi:hypothetical protein
MSTPTLTTYTGRVVNPIDMDPAHIAIEDIAHHLSMLCRFNGATRTFYSVAEHSVRVSRLAERTAAGPTGVVALADAPTVKQIALAGLLHDASEAYLSDVPRPVKSTPGFAGYLQVEAELQARIFARFDLPFRGMPAEVVLADDKMLAIEFRDLIANPPAEFVAAAGLTPVMAYQLRPSQAKEAFLRRFAQLTGGAA